MSIDKWVKIGEVSKSAPLWKSGLYAKYAVMEMIKPNGDRKYKEVLIATWSDYCNFQCQIETLNN